MGRCVWLVGGYRASRIVPEDGVLGVAACVDAVVVEEFVVAGAEQDEVVELGPAATLDRDDVMRFEFACGAAVRVLAMQ